MTTPKSIFSKSIFSQINLLPCQSPCPGVLHCDKASWFCHIEASRVRFVVSVLMVSGDNNLGAAATDDETSIGGCRNAR
jgi:hypothetical protein